MTSASILIPAFNSQATISKLVEDIIQIFIDHEIEFIITNDYSTDNTHEECLQLQKKYPSKVVYIKLRKNYGEHNAVMAAMKFAKFEKIFIIDDDYQNSPNALKKLFDYTFDNKFDVVYTKYKEKKHSFFRNLVSKINDKFVNFILNKPKNIYLSSFKSINNSLAKKILDYNGPYPYIDGIILNITSNIGQVEVEHEQRHKGKSGYNTLKLLQLFGNVVFNFSAKPLRIISLTGFLLSFASFVFGIFTLIEKFTNPNLPLGYTSLVIIILFFSGMQLLIIGILGEYLGRILSILNKNPQYSIDQVLDDRKK